MQERLRQKLQALDGKGYGAYKSIKGTYQWVLPDFKFQLHIDYVQGDPFAEPSRLRATISQSFAAIPSDLVSNQIRTIAARDYLTRVFSKVAKRFSRT